MITRPRRNRRSGATVVETAFILIPLLMFIFGIFEYGRFLMVRNLINNSAREGCRYALVNNTSTTINAEVQTVVNNYMSGQQSAFTGFTVTVSGTHNGTTTSVNNLVAGDWISVTVSGQYTFMNVIPMVKMPTSVTMSSSCVMLCEGVT